LNTIDGYQANFIWYHSQLIDGILDRGLVSQIQGLPPLQNRREIPE
jgi:hypothetical protein